MSASFLLQQNGDKILQQTGDGILLNTFDRPLRKLALASPSEFTDRPRMRPFLNMEGAILKFGEVACWVESQFEREKAELPTTENQYNAAGIIAGQRIMGENVGVGANGWLFTQGIVRVYVRGEITLEAGLPLEVVPGQVYLQKAAGLTDKNIRWSFTLRESAQVIETSLKYVQLDLPY